MSDSGGWCTRGNETRPSKMPGGSPVVMENLEPRLLLSAASELDAALAVKLTESSVIERSVETEFLFAADDAESDGVIVLTSFAQTSPVGEDSLLWNWSGSLAIPDGPEGAWVGINCLEPTGVPAGTVVTRVAVHHEITHTYIGDLQVIVYNGTQQWTVRDGEGGPADNINETRTEYTLFDGDAPVQDWYYRVRDVLPYDTGTLTVMQLYVYYTTAVNAPPEISGVPDVTIEEDTSFGVPADAGDDGDVPDGILGFDGDTAEYLNLDASGLPAGDATPTGDSYILYDNWGGTWSDAEKSPSNTEDDMMCWAAAASNILEWSGWGNVDTMTDSDQMFTYFQDHWTDVGGLPEYGWDWWFDGTNNSAGWSGWSQVDVPGGGFYPTEVFSNYFHENFNDFSNPGTPQSLSAIDSYLRSGYGVTLGIYTDSGGGHAITCWGFNYNPANPTDYYGVWVTDSDDSKSTDTPPDLLRYYEVGIISGRWHLLDYYGTSSWWIGGVQALDAKPGGEPPPPPEAIDLWAYASDSQTPDENLTFSIIGYTNPSAGVAIVGNRYVTVTPAQNWNGTTNVTIRVSDGQYSDTDTFTVTVLPVNDAPDIAGLPDKALRQDTALYYTIELWSYTTDVESYDWTLTFSIVGNTDPDCGAQIVAGHYISIVPTGGWVGTSDVTVQVSDGDLTDTDTFTVTVAEAFVDLTGDFGTVNLATPTKGGDFAVVPVRVTNVGNTTAVGYADLEVWASGDGDLTTPGDDYKLGESRSYIYLPAGATGTYYVYVTVPAGIPAGTYDMVAVVDAADDIDESNENNNQATLDDRVVVQNPDLTGEFWMIGLSATPTPGAWGYAYLRVINDSAVSVYCQMDIQVWATSASNDYLLTTLTDRWVYAPAGGTSLQIATFTLPAGMVAGNYSLHGIVDSANDLVETNEGNNTFLSAGQYVVSGGVQVLTAGVSTNGPAVGASATTAAAPPPVQSVSVTQTPVVAGPPVTLAPAPQAPAAAASPARGLAVVQGVSEPPAGDVEELSSALPVQKVDAVAFDVNGPAGVNAVLVEYPEEVHAEGGALAQSSHGLRPAGRAQSDDGLVDVLSLYRLDILPGV